MLGVTAADLTIERFPRAQWPTARAIVRVRERLCRTARDAKAAAENLPFARHHDFAPMTSPTRVASHATHRKPNSSRASKWITATTACQVKFHRERLRPTRTGHLRENWMVAHCRKLSPQVNRSVTCCPPPGHPQPSSAGRTARVICSTRRIAKRVTRR
jgi:hypothetical protein